MTNSFIDLNEYHLSRRYNRHSVKFNRGFPPKRSCKDMIAIRLRTYSSWIDALYASFDVLRDSVTKQKNEMQISRRNNVVRSTKNTFEEKYSHVSQMEQDLSELLHLGEVDTYSDYATLKILGKIVVTGLEYDYSRVQKGNLYFCISDPNDDKKLHAIEAFERGACAFVCNVEESEKIGRVVEKVPIIEVDDTIAVLDRIANEFFNNPSEKLQLFAVLGTETTTTATWLIRGILEEMDKLVGLICCVEFSIGEKIVDESGVLWHTATDDWTEKRDCSSPFHLTPYPHEKYNLKTSISDSLRVQQIMASFVDRGADSCVMEIDSAKLRTGRFDSLDFNILVQTNSIRHISDHSVTLEDNLDANLKLQKKLAAPERQRAIINFDDPFAHHCARAMDKIPIITYSLLNSQTDVHAEKIDKTIFETSLLINTSLNLRLEILTPLLGKTNVYNVLAAVATGIAFGAPLKTIVNGIEAVDAVPGQYELIDEGQNFAVVVDCAQEPETFSFFLDNIRQLAPYRIITVFGCCGEAEKTKRAFMGEIAHYKSDVVIISNDNPRGEHPASIVKDIVAGWPDNVLLRHSWFLFPWYQDIARLPVWYTDQALWAQSEIRRYIIEDRYLAIRSAVYMAQKNDLVAIMGKGNHDYQEWSLEYLSDVDHHVYQNKSLQLGSKTSAKLIRSWFDDRVECRNALSKLPQLIEMFPTLDRSLLPWVWPGLHRRHPLEEWNVERLTKVSGDSHVAR